MKNGPLLSSIHEMRPPRQPRSKARLGSIYCDTDDENLSHWTGRLCRTLSVPQPRFRPRDPLFSSVQDGIYALGKADAYCAPLRLSEVSPTLPFKQFNVRLIDDGPRSSFQGRPAVAWLMSKCSVNKIKADCSKESPKT